eukprot:NODE_3307_length_803_cov_296.735294.p2 GENE.NODE_3307_length_803_cov_296.735294~~NODE_3307_length_803_cov_296.735294.p2  ORF type:complete len:204 (+),score=57.90 NODE_3307_length_803_cov_296.735294:3-614(+)
MGERIFVEEGDNVTDLQCAKGHRFCADCPNGPHNGTCDERAELLAKEKKAEEDEVDHDEAWKVALSSGWKPCPKKCDNGGGVKAAEECDHVTCRCGHEFCWDCGVTRLVPLVHDCRWHKPACRYHTKYEEVTEPPKRNDNCPECQKMPAGEVCQFPPDDGYPESFVQKGGVRRRRKSASVAEARAAPAAAPPQQNEAEDPDDD